VKTKVTLLIVVLASAFGNAFLSKGMKQLGDISRLSLADMLGTAVGALLNPWVALGVALAGNHPDRGRGGPGSADGGADCAQGPGGNCGPAPLNAGRRRF